jgi:hypothetical protein
LPWGAKNSRLHLSQKRQPVSPAAPCMLLGRMKFQPSGRA